MAEPGIAAAQPAGNIKFTCRRAERECVRCCYREGWVALMAEQGFAAAQLAGDLGNRPRLLSRQTVVVGASDGIILPTAAAAAPRVRLAATLPLPTEQLLFGFR